MNRALSISIGLNLALAGLAAALIARGPKPAAPVPRQAQVPVAREVAAVPVPLPTPAPFSWSRLKSDDYPTFIANLRKVGCPEKTIQDLVAVDVVGLYDGKCRELLLGGTAQVSGSSGAIPVEQRLAALAAERNTVLTGLFPQMSAASLERSNAGSFLGSALPSDVGARAGVSGRPGFKSVETAGQGGSVSPTGSSGANGANQANASSQPAANGSQTATDGTQAGGTTGAQGQASRFRSPFSTEEQVYRAKYGWPAYFDEVRQEALDAGANARKK